MVFSSGLGIKVAKMAKRPPRMEVRLMIVGSESQKRFMDFTIGKLPDKPEVLESKNLEMK